jgi:DNA-binding response OmpR family regulator
MKKILIIEDEPDVAKTIKAYLEGAGYSAEYSLNPEKAVKAIKNFDLLLLDLIMPKFSGRMVLKEMKKLGIKKPVVVLSAISLPVTISQELARDYPGVLFVSKTSMHGELLPAIKKLISE